MTFLKTWKLSVCLTVMLIYVGGGVDWDVPQYASSGSSRVTNETCKILTNKLLQATVFDSLNNQPCSCPIRLTDLIFITCTVLVEKEQTERIKNLFQIKK